MPKILLISLNQCTNPYPVYPLGLAHLEAALRQAGHQVAWLDFQFQAADLAARLAAFQPEYLGLSLRNIDDVLMGKKETFFAGLSGLCAWLREQSAAPLILGGSGFSIFPEDLLAVSGAEYGIQGEGEVALVELLAALEAKRSPADIPGLVYRVDGRVVRNPPRRSENLAGLPAAVRPAEINQHYLHTSSMLSVQTQRGCSFQCCYCTYPVIEGRAWRRRPAEEVAEELAAIKAAGARYFFLVDSVFNSANDHVEAVCEAMLRRNLGLKWGCFLRPSRLTPELMRLMARAGLAHIEFGTDSFCDSVLAAYGKQFSFADIHAASVCAQEAGVDFCHFLICGGPGETMATLEAGFQNSLQLSAGVVLPLVGMRIYPGTALREQAVREGVLAATDTLLAPQYYLARGLVESEVEARLAEFGRRSPRWIVGEAPPTYARLVERLRRQGVVGPLWSFYSWLQQFSAAGAPPVPAS